MGIVFKNMENKDKVMSLISRACNDLDRFERYEALRELDPEMFTDNSYGSILMEIAKNDKNQINRIEAFYLLIKHLGGVKGSSRELAEIFEGSDEIKKISLDVLKKKIILKQISRVTGEIHFPDKNRLK